MAKINLRTEQVVPSLDFATLDLLPYGIIVTDEEGKVLYYNAREEQIACRKRKDVLGKNFFKEVAPCAQVREFYGRFRHAMQAEGSVANFHFTFPFLNRPREVEISLTSFENRGALLCMISVADVTEQNALRERLVHAERLGELGEVAAGVAHNFGNLLMVMRSNAELISVTSEDADTLRRADKIMKASDDGAEMVRRIRESARQQPETQLTQTLVDLNALITDSIAFTEDYAQSAQRERGAAITFRTELVKTLPPVRASAHEMREVFVNLLHNSVDAIEGSGEIIVRSKSAGRGKKRRSVVEVCDTGTGMSAEVMKKLFRPLFTTKGERGTGLGLATCYAIVRRHHGDLEVDSVEGKGTTFTIRLPVASD